MTKRSRADTGAPDQLSFGFTVPALAFEDLFVSPANEAAVSVLQHPENWPRPVLALVGPPKCGLTTLAGAWAQKFGAELLTAKSFKSMKPGDVSDRSATFTVIDDADDVRDSDKLVTLMNLVLAGSGRLLLTSNQLPSQWVTQSADLRSRLNALPVTELYPPDEAMLVGRLKSVAARYFLKLDADTVKYLVPRLDLSYEAIETFLLHLHYAVTRTGRAPRTALAGEVLDELGWRSPDQPGLI